MSIEFVALDANGRGVDWVDPYVSHELIRPGLYAVDNGYATYHVYIPNGGSYVIRPMGGRQ